VYLAVYDGNGAEIRALRCTPQVASGVDAGDMVRAMVTPHLGHVYQVERLGPMVSIHTGS
jgi:hydroxyethylthiazole kinase-like sugar kinase family protein